LPQETTTEQLLAEIEKLNANPDVHGILLQHPVPAQIDERACFDAISLNKDVDGVTCLVMVVWHGRSGLWFSYTCWDHDDFKRKQH
jgi:5,10-methylene-tetrahydrofolate dehydrogenase/methenyl tetrahydrofolate cyclohydrolase